MNEVPRPGRIGNLTLTYLEKNEGFLAYENEQDLIPMNVGDLPMNAKVGDEVEVFILYDENNEITATTKLPALGRGIVESYRVEHLGKAGAYLDIGTVRDMFLPLGEARDDLKQGQFVTVILAHDPKNKRLILTCRLDHYFRNNSRKFERGEKVSLRVYKQIPAAYKVVIEDQYLGIIFEKDCLFRPRIGDKLTGYVKNTDGREPVVSLQKEGPELLEDAKVRIMSALENSRGYLRLTDDSDSEEIKLRLRISKKTFKKAAGMLYKDGKIELGKRGIKLVKK